MKIHLQPLQTLVMSDVFFNLAAGFFGSIIIFPGIFGFSHPLDLLPLLIINLPAGILCVALAVRLKEYL